MWNSFGQLWIYFWIIKKILCITHLSHQNKYATDFKAKAEIFNSSFAGECSFKNNSSKFPSTFLKRTEKVISSILFSSNEITKIIWDLDPNEAHGHHMISIRMLKICGASIPRPLEKMFKASVEKVSFLMNGKKQMWFQLIKKVISKCHETTDLFCYFQYLERYLNVFYLIICVNFH